MDNKVSLMVKCEHCNTSLMDYNQPLHGKPSICVDVINQEGAKGKLWLCSTYGCYDKKCDITLKPGSKVQIFCPKCNKILNTDIPCEKCKGEMVKFNIEIGGVVHACSTVGCDGHFVKINDLTDTLRKFYREYGV